jgi:hypothetical protein
MVMRTNRIVALSALALSLAAAPAQAQLNGENLLGDMGMKSGTQPEPGIYISNLFYRYNTDTIKGPDGETVVLDPTGSGKQTIQAGIPIVTYITPLKIFGAHYGAMAVMPFANGSLEAPGLGLSEKASTGPSDLYVVPIQLGWHMNRADVTAGLGMFVPTGRYETGASDNLGKGMWSYELSGGATVFLDQGRSWSVSAAGYWETHSKKDAEVRVRDVTLRDVKVGQLVTVEGGIGRSFLHGAASVGMAYYAQWKVTGDEVTADPIAELTVPDRHRVWGIGPEVTIPIATKSRLISLVNVRYLWERGAHLKTQGHSFLMTTTFPLGGIKIPAR